MQFLACEVANMHRGLRTSPKERGNAVAVAQKWCLNKELFYLSLDKLMLSQEEREKYSRIGSIMEAACKNCAHYFEQRHRGGHIKRCHGDLKAANLWVRSASLTVRVEHNPKELLALDCVDFQPEFCHVDTLSDVAMLAVDIEMHLGRYTGKCGDGFSSWELTEHFLKTYLRAVGQQKRHKESHQTIWTLLEYYMTEKALICAFMNILYDELPGQGKRYLDVALSHARRLQRIVTNSRLPARCSKPGRSRNSLSRAQQVYHLRRRRVIPDRASQDVQVSNSRRSG
jgi:aminoglycoside phosphotransferase family enzyme